MNYAIYIAAAVVLGLLIAMVALTISWLQKTVLRNIRSKTLNLLSVYDTLLEEKSRALSKMAVPPCPESDPEISPEQQSQGAVMSGAVLNTVERASSTTYRQGDTPQLYRVIRENFSYDMNRVLPVLHQAASSRPGPATELLNKLDYDTVYQLSTLTWQEQEQILSQVLNPQEQSLLQEYVRQAKNPGMLRFHDYLTGIAATEPGPVRLIVTPEAARLYTDPSVEILENPEICEGYQVEQNNLLYDFSIKMRELS